MADGAGHLSVAQRGSAHLAEKLAVLSTAWASALQCLGGFDARPALEALARLAANEHPAAFTWDGRRAAALHLGWAVEGDALREIAAHPSPQPAVGACLCALPPAWRPAGLLALAFAEDFAIIEADGARIPWLAVALPSHWAPQAKVGKHFADVHAPVADNHTLLAAADALARLVCAPTRWERFVWTITPHPRLDAHPERWPDLRWIAGNADTVMAQAHWRTERQSFIPVQGAGQALFTIHVEVQPLAAALDSAHKAQRVHAALASMSPAVLRYRGLADVQAPLLEWLQRRARQ